MSETIDTQAPRVVLAPPFFWAPARLVLPGDDGKKAKFDFRVRFRRLKTSERRLIDLRLAAGRVSDDELVQRLLAIEWLPAEWRHRLNDASDSDTLAVVLNDFRIRDDEFLDLLLVDWDIKDLHGIVVHFTPTSRAELVEDWDGFERAIVAAYFQALRVEDPEKNSETPSAGT